MNNYQLSVITPNGKAFDGQAESLVALGRSGFFGVMAKHAPMVVALRKGSLTVRHGAREHHFALSSGILEVNEQNNVVLLVDKALEAETHDQSLALLENL